MTKQWADELTAFARAFAGAAIFGIPLVFTMEMWWIGESLSLTYLLILFALGFMANVGLDYVAGFRDGHSLGIAIEEAIDALAVGVITATVLLFGINQLRLTDSIDQGLGMVILLSLPLSLGASVAREVFEGRTSANDDSASPLSKWQGLFSDIVATVIGGVFVGLSISPTEEVEMIAAGLRWTHLFVLIGISLLLSYLIVFASGFDEASPPGLMQHPLSETVLSYVISLLVAFMLLMVLERISMADPFHEMLWQSVVLAVPVSIGGAAGRLVI